MRPSFGPSLVAIAVTFLAVTLSCAPGHRQSAGTWKRLELSILEDYDKGEDLDDVDRDFALFRELGIRTWRGSFGWDDYEPARDEFDFDWLHRFADRAAARGIRLRPYLGYTPDWAAAGRKGDSAVWNDPPERLQDWAGFVIRLASEMKRHPNVLSYEIYNEENTHEWWDGSAAEYESVLVTASRAIRSVQPGAQVLLGGMVGPDPDWVETVCAAGPGTFDIAPFHAYPETWGPDSIHVENYLAGTYGDFVKTVDACGRGKGIWINEAGFATVPGKSQRDQAAWWARALATFAAAPRVTGIGVYEIKDLKTDKPAIGGAPNDHLGLTTSDRVKKMAFSTVALFARFFDAESLCVEDDAVRVRLGGPPGSDAPPRAPQPSDGLHVHLFRRPDGQRLLVAWMWAREAATVDIALPGPATRATSYGLDAVPSPMKEFEDRDIRGLKLVPGDIRIIRFDP